MRRNGSETSADERLQPKLLNSAFGGVLLSRFSGIGESRERWRITAGLMMPRSGRGRPPRRSRIPPSAPHRPPRLEPPASDSGAMRGAACFMNRGKTPRSSDRSANHREALPARSEDGGGRRFPVARAAAPRFPFSYQARHASGAATAAHRAPRRAVYSGHPSRRTESLRQRPGNGPSGPSSRIPRECPPGKFTSGISDFRICLSKARASSRPSASGCRCRSR